MEILVNTAWWIWKLDSFFLFWAIFTDSEIKEFETRIKIFKYLEEWKSQRSISKELWISIATVTRWAKIYKQHPKIKGLL